MEKKRTSWLAWLWLVIGLLYLLLPLAATLQFSLQAKRGEAISFIAYSNVLNSPKFVDSFLFSFRTALITIAVSALLIVPTIYWVNLRMRFLRPVIEFMTLLPFVIPAVVLVFGLIRGYNNLKIGGSALTDSSEGVYLIMVGAYVMLSFPYMFRAVDAGLQAINVRALTEAAQSLGANWLTILFRVIFPNVYLAVLNGAFITFAIVMGEFTITSLLSQPGFGPYIFQLNSQKVYEPSAVSVLSFALTWISILILQRLGRGRSGGADVVRIR
jgi:putative spermidine/putrescine transport system permease protein